MQSKRIPVVVLTGGPCAGKTTALERIVGYFSDRGYKVFTIPEVPTIFTASGMNYLTNNTDFFFEGEKATLEMQIALEDKFLGMAKTIKQHPAIVVCDRGTIDISTYLKDEQWNELMQILHLDTESLRNRYDGVVHLTTAAKGMEQYYTTENNAQRLEAHTEEGMRVARMLDDKVLEAWKSHPVHIVINNGEDFELKMAQVISAVEEIVENKD